MIDAKNVMNGDDLRRWRKERGYTQSRAAHMLMSSQKTISNCENKLFEMLPPKLRQQLTLTENPAEARIVAMWNELFGQVINHMQANAMIPPLSTSTAKDTTERMSRHLRDELLAAGVKLSFD